MAKPDGAIPLVEAATRLGVSTDVLRKRVQQGVHPGHKVGGRWYVLLNGHEAETEREQESEQDQTGSRRAGTGQTGSDGAGSERAITILQAEVEFLRDELVRKDHIIAGLVERVPALPSETQEERKKAEPSSSPTPPASSQPWWKRLFGLA